MRQWMDLREIMEADEVQGRGVPKEGLETLERIVGALSGSHWMRIGGERGGDEGDGDERGK